MDESCPNCGGRIERECGVWCCDGCGFANAHGAD